MKRSANPYFQFVVSAILLWGILVVIYPYFQYYIDPDGTSYLTISKRYASGDYLTAVNGLWSPWACWLTALLIKAGISPVPASIVVNTAGATGFLGMSLSLFVHFGVDALRRWQYSLATVVFLSFAIFHQSFSDLWQCFLLLVILRILVAPGYSRKPTLWVASGAVAAIAYFAKAYSLPYFALLTIGSTYFLSNGNKLLWAKMVVVAGAVMAVCSFPWLYALHTKYGIWTTSNAGPLNMSWYLVGHPLWNDTINILLPPVYSNSVYYWEDPYFVNGALTHYWDSWHYAGLQVLRLGYNCLSLVYCMAQLSVFLPLIGIYLLYSFIKKHSTLSASQKVIYLAFLILPLGYIMVHVESRYLWLMLPISIIAAYHILPKLNISPALRKVLAPAFVLSLMVYPVYWLAANANEGRAEYQLAQQLNAAGVTGIDMVSNLHPRLLSKINYFSANRFYVISKQKPQPPENKAANTSNLLKDMQRYGVSYYLYSPMGNGKLRNPGFDEIFFDNLSDGITAIPYQVVFKDAATRITLYRLTNSTK